MSTASKNKIELKITGMSCEGCANTVKHALANVSGVVRATVDLKSGLAEVEISDPEVTSQQLIQAVIKSGYGASENQ